MLESGWCNGLQAGLECRRSRVWIPVEVNIFLLKYSEKFLHHSYTDISCTKSLYNIYDYIYFNYIWIICTYRILRCFRSLNTSLLIFVRLLRFILSSDKNVRLSKLPFSIDEMRFIFRFLEQVKNIKLKYHKCHKIK